MHVPQPRHRRSHRIGRLARYLGGMFDRVYALACRKSPTESYFSLTRYPLGNIFWLECRNFLARIELLYTKFVWEGVDVGPWYRVLSCGCAVANTSTDENMRCIRQLRAIFPWATAVDSQILVETLHTQRQRMRGLEDSDLSRTQEKLQPVHPCLSHASVLTLFHFR